MICGRMSAFGGKADVARTRFRLDINYNFLMIGPNGSSHVRFRGQSGHSPLIAECPLMTQSGHRLWVAKKTQQTMRVSAIIYLDEALYMFSRSSFAA
jgi:hypothetical protein